MIAPVLLTPDRMLADGGPCFKVVVHDLPFGDALHRQCRSRLQVLEDGSHLGPGHSLHDEIRGRGFGRYSHWHRELFFSASDNSDPRDNGRTYQLVWQADAPSPLSEADRVLLDEATAALRCGGATDLDAINRLMLLPKPEQRGHVFRALADALYVDGRTELADEQMVRAWHQGVRDRDVFSQALLWSRRHGDDDRTRWLLQSAARLAADTGDVEWMVEIILRHHEWQGDQYTRTARSFHQDEFLIGPLTDAFRPHRLVSPPRPVGTKLRVGYVLAGEACRDFISLPGIICDMAIGHDPAEVAARIISLNSEQDVAASPLFPPLRDALSRAGIPLDFLPTGGSFRGLAEGAQAIAAMDLDVLIFGNATHWNLLMAALHPARVVAGLGMGECELFSSTLFDRTFHLSFGPARDGRGNTHFLRAGNVPASRFITPDQVQPRAAFGLSEDCLILLSCARAVKFLEPLYWTVMAQVLDQSPQAVLVVVGLSAEEFARIPGIEAIPAAIRARIHPLGWRNDAPTIVGIADIFIDTFPNGGGLSAIEAMHLGIPVVAVRESPFALFDERTWSPVPEMFDEIAAPPLDDPAAIAESILALARSPEARAGLGARGKAEVEKVADRRSSSAMLAAAYRQALTEEGWSP